MVGLVVRGVRGVQRRSACRRRWRLGQTVRTGRVTTRVTASAQHAGWFRRWSDALTRGWRRTISRREVGPMSDPMVSNRPIRGPSPNSATPRPAPARRPLGQGPQPQSGGLHLDVVGPFRGLGEVMAAGDGRARPTPTVRPSGMGLAGAGRRRARPGAVTPRSAGHRRRR